MVNERIAAFLSPSQDICKVIRVAEQMATILHHVSHGKFSSGNHQQHLQDDKSACRHFSSTPYHQSVTNEPSPIPGSYHSSALLLFLALLILPHMASVLQA